MNIFIVEKSENENNTQKDFRGKRKDKRKSRKILSLKYDF